MLIVDMNSFSRSFHTQSSEYFTHIVQIIQQQTEDISTIRLFYAENEHLSRSDEFYRITGKTYEYPSLSLEWTKEIQWHQPHIKSLYFQGHDMLDIIYSALSLVPKNKSVRLISTRHDYHLLESFQNLHYCRYSTQHHSWESNYSPQWVYEHHFGLQSHQKPKHLSYLDMVLQKDILMGNMRYQNQFKIWRRLGDKRSSQILNRFLSLEHLHHCYDLCLEQYPDDKFLQETTLEQIEQALSLQQCLQLKPLSAEAFQSAITLRL